MPLRMLLPEIRHSKIKSEYIQASVLTFSIDTSPFMHRIIPMDKLFFGFGNGKLSKSIATFSLPAGWTCPGAQDCLSKFHPDIKKIVDGVHTQFRCFSATSEAVFPIVRKNRWTNFELLKNLSTDEMVKLITVSLPPHSRIVRLHVSGDFFNDKYFLAWLAVAKSNPNTLFYGYTKRIDLLVTYRKELPSNFRIVSSLGSKFDDLVYRYGLKYAKVVGTEKEAEDLGLPLDHNDSLAMEESDTSFALLIHGTQPKNTRYAKLWN